MASSRYAVTTELVGAPPLREEAASLDDAIRLLWHSAYPMEIDPDDIRPMLQDLRERGGKLVFGPLPFPVGVDKTITLEALGAEDAS